MVVSVPEEASDWPWLKSLSLWVFQLAAHSQEQLLVREVDLLVLVVDVVAAALLHGETPSKLPMSFPVEVLD